MLSGTPLAASRLLRGRTGRRDETPPSKVFIFGNFDGVVVLDGGDVVCVCGGGLGAQTERGLAATSSSPDWRKASVNRRVLKKGRESYLSNTNP